MAIWNGQVKFEQKGNFRNLKNLADSSKKNAKLIHKLNELGEKGCAALRSTTPKDTGKTSESWYYKVEEDNNTIAVKFYNSNVNNHVNIAIILQFGHGTRNGGYVQGIDYINPALHPLFENIANQAWREVISK